MKLSETQLKQLRATPVGATGNRLQAAIDIAGTTQTAVAKRLGQFGAAQVSDLARGRRGDVLLSTAHDYAQIFGCRVEDLFPAPAGDQVGA